MTPLDSITKILLTLLLVGNLSLAQKPAPTEPSDPQTRTIQQCIALMKQSQWQQTLDLLTPLIQQNKTTGLKAYGAKFATSYYYKGLCLIKLAQQKKNQPQDPQQKQQPTAKQLLLSAIQSLNQCYSINPPNDPSNTYRVKSLLLRGNAQQSLGKYQLAIDSYKLFLHERNTALDSYQLASFNVNLAHCLWNKPNKTPAETTQAITLLQQALLYTGRNNPSPHTLLSALRILTDIAITTRNADLIPATIQHTRTTSPANLILPAHSLTQLLPLLSKLITHTSLKDLPLASLHLTTLIPGISQHSLELEIPPTLEIPALEKSSLDPVATLAIKTANAIALQARALTFQKSNNPANLHNSIRLYTALVDQYPDTPHQSKNLYNLTRLSAQSSLPDHITTAITRAHQFLKNYPTHPLKNHIITILLNTLHHSQQYQEALNLAEKTLANLDTTATDPATSSLHDASSFIRAASHYYLGNFTTAAPLLTAHQSAYPDSPYQTTTAYLTAAVQNQLLHWDTSIPLLRKFIAQHSTPSPSIYTPFASYDIAFAHYSQRQLHSSILSLIPFTLDLPFIDPFGKKQYTQSQISASASILLGNTHLLLGERHTAVAHYQIAIQRATDTGNISARDEAYYLLIDLLGKPTWEGLRNKRLSETVPHFLHFLTLENAKKSPYYTQILTSAITALEKANPTEPVHLRLQENLFLHNTKPNTPGIETALKTYLYYLRKNNKTTTEITQLLSDLSQTKHSAYHLSILTAAQIETLEHALKRARNPDAITTLQTQINKHYQNLINQFQAQDIDNFTLLKIAHHLTKSNKLTEATTYHQTIINSSSNIKKTEARLGLATQLATSNDPTKKQTAHTQLTQILNNPFTPPAPRATTHYQIIQLLHQEKKWQEIETNAITYLKYPLSVKTHKLEVQQLLALAYDRQGKVDSAISTYTHLWATTFFSIQHSAPALDRACQLLWERNTPATPAINEGKSDRQLAYETAYKYIRKTKDHFAQRKASLSPPAIQTWQAIKTNAITTYPKDPSVKPFNGKP